MVAFPVVGWTRPSTIRSVVVLPAPLGPRKPVTEPGSTVKLSRSTARTSPPKSLVSWSTTIRPSVRLGRSLEFRDHLVVNSSRLPGRDRVDEVGDRVGHADALERAQPLDECSGVPTSGPSANSSGCVGLVATRCA